MNISAQRAEASIRIKNSPVLSFKAEGFDCKLTSYQAQGAAFLLVAERALLLYFVGAGKTPISIGADCKFRELGKVVRTLVVGLSGARFHWASEYKKFTGLNVRVIDGPKKDRVHQWHDAQWADVTVSHYEALRADIGVVESLNYDLMIFDEASFFKSGDTAISAALMRISERPSYVFGLTATPIQKKLEDLHRIMEKVNASVLGDFSSFETDYIIKELASVRVNGRPRKFWKITGYKNVQDLQQKMEPYYIRKTQDDVPELERKRVKVIRPIYISDIQARHYRDVVAALHNFKGDRMSLLEKFRLLEYCCGSMAFFSDQAQMHQKVDFSAGYRSSKLEDLIFLLENELKDEKVVVFSKYKLMLYHAQYLLDKAGIRWTQLTGDVEANQREANRVAFIEDPIIQVCLVTQAAEMSINLHSARYIIFLSEIYNPARQTQIIGRIDRPFLQKSKIITSIHYSVVGSFEPQLHQRMQEETDLAESVLGSGEFVEKMNFEDLLNLMKQAVPSAQS